MPEFMVGHTRKPATFLLVEDNEGDIFLTREAFRSGGITNSISVAFDGEEALSILRQEGHYSGQSRPDLVLLDLNLPRLDGREVLMQMKTDLKLKTIPVVVMSHSSVQIEVLKQSDLQADGYTTKPIDLEYLREVLAAIGGFRLDPATQPANSASGAKP